MESYDLTEGTILTENDRISDELIPYNNKKYIVHIFPIWQWLIELTGFPQLLA